MELLLQRKWFTSESTCGTLQVDGVNECFTLEKPWNGGDNEPQTSCILPGRYRIALHASPHLGATVPMLLDVPGRTYILIHWGNQAKDVLGCILVGRTHSQDWVGVSKDEFNDYLMPKIQAALQAGGEVWITVQDAR
jgi:hypothetical protein